MAEDKASPKGEPKIIQTAKVIIAIDITTGTKTRATLSAIFAIGAFELAASSTKAITLEKEVSSPFVVAFIFSTPEIFIVAAFTSSFLDFETGKLSPVRAASFTELMPSTTIPSTGMLSPGRTIKISPTSQEAASIWISVPSACSKLAVLGDKSTSF